MANSLWTALFNSQTFWGETIPLVLATLLVLLVFLALVGLVSRGGMVSRLARLRGIHESESGAASVFDFALTIPIFITVVFVLTQLALMANASLIIHFSAYSAARAAKTQLLDMDHAFWELDCCALDTLIAPLAGAAALADQLFEPSTTWREETDKKVRTAAAFQLISLAPSKRSIAPDRESSVNFDQIGMSAYLATLVNEDSKRTNVLLHKAQYAFDERFTLVNYGSSAADILEKIIQGGQIPTAEDYGELLEEALVAWELAKTMSEPAHALATITTVPVYAEVSFRFPLLVPFASSIFNQSDLNALPGQKGIWLSARVDLS